MVGDRAGGHGSLALPQPAGNPNGRRVVELGGDGKDLSYQLSHRRPGHQPGDLEAGRFDALMIG
jgi:hypothetical protein